jgi:hypothetical protein
VSQVSGLPGYKVVHDTTVRGYGCRPRNDSGEIGAELRLVNGVTLSGKFDGEFASHSSTYAGTGTVRYTW